MKFSFNEKENNILDAAMELVIRYGYDKTSIAQIAKEAGIGKGTIYLYFATKDQLMESMFLREIYSHNMKWYQLVMEDPQGGLLHRMYINQLKAIITSKLMEAIFRKDDNVFGSYLKRKNNFFLQNSNSGLGEDFIRMMQDVNCIRQDVDPKITSHIIDIIGYGLTSISEIKSGKDIPENELVIDGIAKMMERAFVPEDGGDSEAGKTVLSNIFKQAKESHKVKESEV